MMEYMYIYTGENVYRWIVDFTVDRYSDIQAH